MQLLNPDTLRLVPGQVIQAPFARGPGDPAQVGFFVRTLEELGGAENLNVQQRAGLIRFNNVLLVLTMLRVEANVIEAFDLWWDYFSKDSQELFDRMSRQESLTVHFYSEHGRHFSLDMENSFRRFFSFLPDVFQKSEPWNEVEFDRAVRGFCAQSYPKENLWDLIRIKSDEAADEGDRLKGIDDYPGFIPDELHPFYDYLPTQGHCIRVIPSMFEDKATGGDPESFLFPAPVKTVLRCGIRWAKGYPVAPIPFIPGHGLAVPPDDSEF